jgi:hypothetical protein
MNTYILQGEDGQEYTVEASSPLQAALRLKSNVETLDGYSVAQLTELLKPSEKEVSDDDLNEHEHHKNCSCKACEAYFS